MRITKAQRQGLREAIFDERFTIQVLNDTLAQSNLRTANGPISRRRVASPSRI